MTKVRLFVKALILVVLFIVVNCYLANAKTQQDQKTVNESHVFSEDESCVEFSGNCIKPTERDAFGNTLNFILSYDKDDLLVILPNDPLARNLYLLYLSSGNPPREAAAKVLELYIRK